MARATPRPQASPAGVDMGPEDFFDLAGHELRGPITAMKGQIQLLQRRLGKEESPEAALADKLLFQSERLTHTLQVFLDAAHVARGGIHLLPADTPYNLADLITRVIGVYSAGTAAGHSPRFEAGREREGIIGNWDRVRIETVLHALLGNALRYSEDGEVTVRLTRDGEMARIEVGDRGVGVPASERAAIFEAYTHGSNVENPGVGLGLPVARAIVTAHGGRIGVRSRRDGGSVFWFTLPLAGLPPLAPPEPL